MIFYSSLFLAFLYFKLARVYKKEEKTDTLFWVQNTLVALAIGIVLLYGFTHESWYVVLLVGYLFLIVSSLMVSAVQLGIFINGKPFIKVSHLYKMMPLLGMLISFASLYLWGI